MGGINTLLYQRSCLGTFFSRLGEREAAPLSSCFGSFGTLLGERDSIVTDGEDAFFARAIPDQLKPIAPSLGPARLYFEVKPFSVG